MADQQTRNELIESRINTEVAGALPMSELGVVFRSMGEVMEFAKMMAVSGPAVPPVFRGNPGACLAVAIKAHHLGFEPFSFASKCYFVNEQLAYEGQLIHAIITQRAPFTRRPTVRYSGEGQERRCHVTFHMAEPDGRKRYDSPMLKDIKPQNSPLWKTDPDQQLHYYSVRAAARRHTPDVILGMYDPEEMAMIAAKDITPRSIAKSNISERLKGGEPVVFTQAERHQSEQTSAEGNDTGDFVDVATGEDSGEEHTVDVLSDLEADLAKCASSAEVQVVADEFAAALSMLSSEQQQTADEMLAGRRLELVGGASGR